MDTSHFEKTDANTVLARLAVEALRENKDPKKVLIRTWLEWWGAGSTSSKRFGSRQIDFQKTRHRCGVC